MVVVFPAPLGPRRQNSLSCSMENQEPLIAQKGFRRWETGLAGRLFFFRLSFGTQPQKNLCRSGGKMC